MLFPTEHRPSTSLFDHLDRPHPRHSVAQEALDDLYRRIDEDLADL